MDFIKKLIRKYLKNTDERLHLASLNVLFMIFIKGGTVLISFLYVPLLINVMSQTKYGIWITLTSIIGWFYVLDVGIGNGLRNKLVIALADNDIIKARKYISTGYAAITIISSLLILTFLLLSPHINWTKVFNAPAFMEIELRHLVNYVLGFFCLQFILSLVNSILFAFQMPALASLIILIGQVISYMSILFVKKICQFPDLITIGIVISITPVFVLLTFTIYFFSTKFKKYKPSFRYIEFDYLSDIAIVGLKFFVLQINTIVFYQTSNIIIAHIIGPEGVTEFNIAFKYLGVISMVFTIILTPFWSASTDAYARGDLDWIKKMNIKLKKIWLAFSLFGIILLILSDIGYKLWLNNSIKPDKTILVSLYFYFILNMLYGSYGYILNGIGKIKLQLLITSIMAILYVPLSYFFGGKYGIVGVISIMGITAFGNYIWAKVQFKKILNNTASGLWNK